MWLPPLTVALPLYPCLPLSLAMLLSPPLLSLSHCGLSLSPRSLSLAMWLSAPSLSLTVALSISLTVPPLYLWLGGALPLSLSLTVALPLSLSLSLSFSLAMWLTPPSLTSLVLSSHVAHSPLSHLSPSL